MKAELRARLGDRNIEVYRARWKGQAPTTDHLATIGLHSLTSRRGGRSSACQRVAFSPDGRTIAATFADGSLSIWDVSSGKELRFADVHEPELLRILAFSPAGDRLVTGGNNGLRVWDARTGHEVANPLQNAVVAAT